MPHMELSYRRQKAVLWEATGVDDYNEPIVSAPEELDCRWVNKRREMVGNDGTPIAVDATVVVDREIPINSLMWEGSLDDLPAGTSFTVADGQIMKVLLCNRTPDIKARVNRYTAGLMRFRDVLPEVQ